MLFGMAHILFVASLYCKQRYNRHSFSLQRRLPARLNELHESIIRIEKWIQFPKYEKHRFYSVKLCTIVWLISCLELQNDSNSVIIGTNFHFKGVPLQNWLDFGSGYLTHENTHKIH